MNAERLREIEAAQSGIARKILEVIPTTEAWPGHAIGAELYRVTRSRVDKSVMMGCLKHLLSDGLIREPERGMFRRVVPNEHRLKVVAEPEPEPMPEPEPVDTTPADPLELLANAASDVRDLAAALLAVAEQIEEVALITQTTLDAVKAKTAQLDQLRALLKGLQP